MRTNYASRSALICRQPALVSRSRTPRGKLRTRPSGITPLAQQVVIAADEELAGRLVGTGLAEPLDRRVHVEQQGPLCIVADEALHPEHASQPYAARDRRDLMQAGGGIDDHVAGGKLDAVRAEVTDDPQLAAIVVGGVAEEERGRDVGAQLAARGRIDSHRAVDMRAIAHAL